MKPDKQTEDRAPSGPLAARALLAAFALVGVFFLGRAFAPDGRHSRIPTTAPNPPGMDHTDAVAAEDLKLKQQLARGRELSQTFCVACHIYPEPGILDRFTWAKETLPRMAFWVGHGDYNLADEPDFVDLKNADALPTAPLMPLEDWRAICDYYLHVAPLKAVEIDRPKTQVGLSQFTPRVIPSEGPALSAMIRIVPGKRQLLIGNGGKNTIELIGLDGTVTQSAQVDSHPVNADRVGGGWEICLIGSLPPVDIANGKVVFLPDSFGPIQTLLQQLRRPIQTLAHDLNGDGRNDRILNQYGNILGSLTIGRASPDGTFAAESLIDQPGAARCAVADFNGDGRPDIAVIFAQARESVSIFLNDGNGGFTPISVSDFHPAMGNVHLEIADFNADGKPDILTCSGDSADYTKYPSPRRAYHGIRIFLNQGAGTDRIPSFEESFFFPMYGAYKAFARDFDNDGDLDIAACSYFPDYATRPEDSFVYLENNGGMKFTATTCGEALSGRWIAMDAADADGDGDIDVALASFVDGPGSVPERLSREWDVRGAAVLYLENTLR